MSDVPRATYRLQFNSGFTFDDGRAILPYLARLGVSHVYASPFLKARAGSPHGYDIVDHNALNPEIGDENSFDAYTATLHGQGLGQVLDIVPNHMGVGGDDNHWWLDVLENGEASRYAGYFDIDWRPNNPALQNKLLLPFLGDHYGNVLENGELRLHFDAAAGSFAVRYYEHLFPLDPRTYPQILAPVLERLGDNGGDHRSAALATLIGDCRALPRRNEVSAARQRKRQQQIPQCKKSLAALCERAPDLLRMINAEVERCNGTAGEPRSFDRLHQILEAQSYRLAYWLVAADDINYRRFFDINDLAGLRMEEREVFSATHRLLSQLLAQNRVQGLRLDHPDGLSDPKHYFQQLRQLIGEVRGDESAVPIWVEKILAHYERLPGDWPVEGTTGYNVAQLLNGIQVHGDAERAMTLVYNRFTGQRVDFDELLYERKKLIMRSTLASELTVLANLAASIARANRHTRDFTYNTLRDNLGEIVACFPVYRTYVTSRQQSEEDARYVQWAVAQAKRRNPARDPQIFDFLKRLMLLENYDRQRAGLRRQILHFALRLQQYTAPMMAKSLEDTAFYIDNRLVSLNDVGFDPRVFSVSSTAFHRENINRLQHWPDEMVTTSTHDSKRSEDVRARINVLSELPLEWRRQVRRWRRINQRKKKELEDDTLAPSANDEYLLYQTLLGAWPPGADSADATFIERIENYMIKALREAKVHTSWININTDYEDAVRQFVRALLHNTDRNPFLDEFLPLQRRVAQCGQYTSLTQTLLKLTIPGIPDIYQGNELWSFDLVDPDNRRPVDYAHRRQLLEEMIHAAANADDVGGFAASLLHGDKAGRSKLYVTWRTLQLRAQLPRLFARGDYLPLTTEGERAEHIIAFARRDTENTALVATGRWFALLASDGQPPCGECWRDNAIATPDESPAAYREVFTGATLYTEERDGRQWLPAPFVFARLPVALLLRQADRRR